MNNRLFLIEKSFCPELITEDEFYNFLSKGGYSTVDENSIEKSAKDTSKLIKKEVWVNRGGRSFRQTVYIKPDTDEEVETPVGEQISPEVKGLQIERYSDKSILIKGDTYANVYLMRKIKQETGFGSWNSKLKGWLYSFSQVDKVLGLIYSDVKDEDKAEAIKNQKNSSVEIGSEINIGDLKGEVKDNVSDSGGIKYDVTLDNGVELTGVDEKVIDVKPITKDSEIAEIVGNSQPENRAKTEKKLFGIQPIEDIHNYSLGEYLKMHGLTDEDVNTVLNRIKPKPKTEGEKKPSTSSTSSKPKSDKEKTTELTKNQLIGKLIYKHYNAVKQAIERGDEVKDSVLETYSSLKEEYSKKRQAMSEETKRKISEALKKDGQDEVKEEAKKQAEAFINSLSKEDLEDIKNQFKAGISENVKMEQSKLADIVVEHETLKKEKTEVDAKSRAMGGDYTQRSHLEERSRALRNLIAKKEKQVNNQKNIVTALSNGGDMMEITDAVGVKHDRVPDFTRVDTEDISFDVDNILTKEKPSYIPEINEAEFKSGSFIFDTIKIGKDRYLLSTNKYRENDETIVGYDRVKGDYDPEGGGFVALTLDQLVLTQDYYVTKQKAIYKQEAEEKNKRSAESWYKMDDKRKEFYYNQYNFYGGLPVNVKKQITKEDWNNLPLQEKEKLYIPVKKYNAEKIKSRFDERHMAGSFHSMYERFVNPEAKRTDKSGNKVDRGVNGGVNYAHPEAWTSWENFRQTLDWKINDINIQREEIEGLRSKAIETSYGESNTNDSLIKEYGVKVKRQNGEDIKPQEIEQLKLAWEDVQKTFGTLKENAEKDNLKLSHAGKTYMFASTAIGVYVPKMKTIGVTAKFGSDQLGFTMGHEVAHWIDHTLGREKGRRHASDNYESTAGQIATLFRSNMNKESNSKYINATHECFARAMEMHHAISTKGEGVLIADRSLYIDQPNYVSLKTYNEQIKPLVEKFLDENKQLLKSLQQTLFN